MTEKKRNQFLSFYFQVQRVTGHSKVLSNCSVLTVNCFFFFSQVRLNVLFSMALLLNDVDGHPLLDINRINNHDDNPSAQVRANVYRDLQSIQEYSPKAFVFFLAFSIFEIIVTAAMLTTYKDQVCDKSLPLWIGVYSGRFIITLPSNIYKFLNRNDEGYSSRPFTKFLSILNILLALFVLAWWVTGQVWVFGTNNCATNSRPLYIYTIVLIALLYLAILLPFIVLCLLCLCFPCVIILVAFFAEKEGATEADIEKLTKISFKKGQPNASGRENQDTCAICMTDFEDGDQLILLPCTHMFHGGDCGAQWLKIKKTCPICRAPIYSASPMSTSSSAPLVGHEADQIV